MIQFATFTDPGDRLINEDAINCMQSGTNTCCVLCDGLGGHGMGDIASALVTEVFRDAFFKASDMKGFLGEAFTAAQEILMTEQAERNAKRKMKTTAVALALDGKNAYIGHIGDSRLYVFKNNKVKFRTKDHSIPQMLVLSGDIKESEIRNHPDRNIVLRVMGVDWDEPMFELEASMPLKKCNAFLLCSDGFWELIEEPQMCACLKAAASPEEWLRMMTAEVKQNGVGRNMDNYSAIAVWNV